MGKFLCEHKFSVFFCMYLRVNLRDHMVTLCFCFWGTAKPCFQSGCIIFTFPLATNERSIWKSTQELSKVAQSHTPVVAELGHNPRAASLQTPLCPLQHPRQPASVCLGVAGRSGSCSGCCGCISPREFGVRRGGGHGDLEPSGGGGVCTWDWESVTRGSGGKPGKRCCQENHPGGKF